MFGDSHVYKRPTLRLRNSKQVLFCTNTSRKTNLPIPYLVNHDPRANTLYRILLSLERLPRNFDLAIRVMTTRNNHGLERSGGVREAEKHDHGLEKATIRLKGGFPLIAVSNTYVVVSPPDV